MDTGRQNPKSKTNFNQYFKDQYLCRCLFALSWDTITTQISVKLTSQSASAPPIVPSPEQSQGKAPLLKSVVNEKIAVLQNSGSSREESASPYNR